MEKKNLRTTVYICFSLLVIALIVLGIIFWPSAQNTRQERYNDLDFEGGIMNTEQDMGTNVPIYEETDSMPSIDSMPQE